LADRNLRFVLSGVDQSASSTLGKAAEAGESASKKIGGAFQSLGDKIGGEFGEVLNKLGEGIESVGEHGLSLGKKLAIGGGVAAGVGVALTAMGSQGKQATDQLKQSILNTGASYEDYAGKIDKVVKKEENFAHKASDTKDALRTLTDATGDEQKALDNMQLVTDLAAAKHISLADAAALVAKILSGGGAKTLKQYGITMGENADGTKDVAGALDQLGAKLQGQAAASMDNFGSKVDIVKTKLGDFVDEIGQKVGPILTVGGTLIGTASSAMDILAIRSEKAAANTAKAGTSLGEAAAAAGGGAAFGPVGLALGAVGVAGFLGAKALGLFGKRAHEQVQPVQELTDAIKADSDAFGTNTKAQIVHDLSSKGLYDSALKLGISQDTLTSAVLGNAKAAQKVADAVNGASTAYEKNETRVQTTDAKTGALITTTHHATQAQKDARDAAVTLADSLPHLQDQLDASKRAALNEAAAMGKLSVKGQDAAQQVKTVGANIAALKSKQIDITTYVKNVILPTVRGPSAGERHHASGGMLSEGWNIVNEPNDEWLYKQGSQVQVYPHGTGGPTKMQGSQSGAIIVNVNVAGTVVREGELVRSIVHGIDELRRRRGRGSILEIPSRMGV
jgi:hypothetical protein